LFALGAAGCAYVGWTLYGTRDAARFALWHHRLGPARAWPLPSARRSVTHLIVQFGLAELLVWLGAPAGVPGLLWLVLLPPVGFAVMFLRPPAVAVVSALSLTVHTFNVAYWHGSVPIPMAVSGFSVAVLFTLVFTQIAVSAEKAQAMNHLALQEVRRSVSALRASPLQDRPLDEALRQLVAENEAAGLRVDVDVLGPPRALSPQVALALYRAAQEGLTNCRKHSGVSVARMTADYRERERVRLTVSDDGAGVGEAREGFGVLGLKERAHLLGGTVVVRTAPGQGFALEVEVPG
jgi:hypothetical protein